MSARRPRARGALFSVLLAASSTLLGCTSAPRARTPQPMRASSVEGDEIAAPSAPALARARAIERIAVRLTAFEREPHLALGIDGAAPFEVWSADGLVQDGSGERAASLRYAAARDGLISVQAVRGGRASGTRALYRGSLAVEAGPGGSLILTNELPLEDYVRGVLPGELAVWSAPDALLEAQAVAARSYALAVLAERGARGELALLRDDTAAQAYRGEPDLGATPAARALSARLARAVERTHGEVLHAQERVLDARFHAACGGYTAAFADIFTNAPDLGAMPAVECPGCRALARSDAVSLTWRHTFERAEVAAFAQKLGISETGLSLEPLTVDAHRRWLSVRLSARGKERTMSFEDLRAHLGRGLLRSAQLVSLWPRPGEEIRGGLAFVGLGNGHGVGLCQAGARWMAERGRSADAILAHYYPGARRAALAPVELVDDVEESTAP